jgi:hypothetical protein
VEANNIWIFPNMKNNMGNHFQLSSQELHLEPNRIGKRLYVPSLSLASLLLSHQHQPECVLYTTVYRGVWCAVSTDK